MENRNLLREALAELIHAQGTGLTGLNPRQALQRIIGARAGNSGKNHVGRDVSTLRCLGVHPRKVCGRWIVPPTELARWAAGHGQIEPEMRPAAGKRAGRPRKAGGAL